MRVLLDESIPRKFGLEIPGHFVQSVHQRGWAGLKNGELLRTASAEFDVLVTGDRNLEYQQNPATLAMAVVVLIRQQLFDALEGPKREVPLFISTDLGT